MGYFSGLFPELDEPELEQQQVLGGPGSDTRRKNDYAREKSEQGLRQQRSMEDLSSDPSKETSQGQDLRSEQSDARKSIKENKPTADYTVAKANLTGALSSTVKAIDKAKAERKLDTEYSLSSPLGTPRKGKEWEMLDSVRSGIMKYAAGATDNKPNALLQISDDLLQLGTRLEIPELLDASKKLATADKSQREMNINRVAGAPASERGKTPDEMSARLTELAASRESLKKELLTAGNIRRPTLQKQLVAEATEERQLRQQIDSQRPIDQPVDSAGQPKPAEPPNPNHINDVFKNLGVDAWAPMLGTFAAGLGLSQGQLNTPITTVGPAFLRVLAAVDKKNVIPQYMNNEMSVARRLDQEQYAREDAKMSRSEKMEQEEQSRLSYERTASRARIESKEMQLRQLYDRLKETPIMRTWYGMIAYVLLSILTRSPSFAARTLMGSQHPEVLGNELRRIQQSIEKEDRWGQHLSQQYSASRRQAIQNQQGREERLEQRSYMERKEQSKMQAYAERARARAEEVDRKERAKEAVTAIEKRNANIDKKLTAAYDRAVYERESQRRIARAEKESLNGDKVKMKAAEEAAAKWDAEAQDLGDKLRVWDAQFLPVFERE